MASTKKKKSVNTTNLIMYVIIGIAILAGLFFVFQPSGNENIDTSSSQVIEETPKGQEIKVAADGTKYIVDPSKIRGGGPPKDGIPSIDNPKFVSVDEADEWIEGNELILVMEHKGEKRIYPLQIMVWHEIVNDNIAGDPILITYCPLCGSGIAYERTIDGGAVEFGTSGKLYNSNLVMYDRLTDTYWSQIDGVAIVGELTGSELTDISIDTVSWGEYTEFAENRDAQVLSQDTGFSREYGRDPYGNYYTDSFLIFPVEQEDNRVHAKTVIFGIEVDGAYTAYRESDLLENSEITDVVNGVNVKVTREADGIVTIINLDTQEEIVKERDFWFAWYAFHPETSLYGVEPQS